MQPLLSHEVNNFAQRCSWSEDTRFIESGVPHSLRSNTALALVLGNPVGQYTFFSLSCPTRSYSRFALEDVLRHRLRRQALLEEGVDRSLGLVEALFAVNLWEDLALII